MTDDPVVHLGPVSGRGRDVSVTLTDLSARHTTKGTRYPYPDFGSDFIEAIHNALVAPQRRGLFWSKLVCPLCGTSLNGDSVTRVRVSAELAFKGIPTVLVDLDIPGLECPGCGQRVVMIDDQSVDSDLSDALVDAFSKAGLTPG